MLKHFSLHNRNSNVLTFGVLTAVLAFNMESNSMEFSENTYTTERSIINPSNTYTYFPVIQDGRLYSLLSDRQLTVNGNVYNIFHYAPNIIYINNNSEPSEYNSTRSHASPHNRANSENSRILNDNNETLKKEFNDTSSISWAASDKSLSQLIDTQSYKTVILEINKLDNKNFQNSNDVLLRQMKNTMCDNSVNKKKKFQLNNKPIKTEIAETVLNALTHIYTPGFIG